MKSFLNWLHHKNKLTNIFSIERNSGWYQHLTFWNASRTFDGVMNWSPNTFIIHRIWITTDKQRHKQKCAQKSNNSIYEFALQYKVLWLSSVVRRNGSGATANKTLHNYITLSALPSFNAIFIVCLFFCVCF